MSQPGYPTPGFKFPLTMGWTSLSSGDVHTNEVQHVRGGGRAATMYSGMVAPTITSIPGAVAGGSDVLVFSGAGRLNSIYAHTQLISGISVFFYDSAVPTSGGPFSASGHKVVGILPPTYSPGAVSGTGFLNFNTQALMDMPFQSGLCFNSRSGQPGFSISWTPEVSAAYPNP